MQEWAVVNFKLNLNQQDPQYIESNLSLKNKKWRPSKNNKSWLAFHIAHFRFEWTFSSFGGLYATVRKFGSEFIQLSLRWSWNEFWCLNLRCFGRIILCLSLEDTHDILYSHRTNSSSQWADAKQIQRFSEDQRGNQSLRDNYYEQKLQRWSLRFGSVRSLEG